MKIFGIAVKVPKAKRISRIQWFSTKSERDWDAAAYSKAGYKVRKLKKKRIV